MGKLKFQAAVRLQASDHGNHVVTIISAGSNHGSNHGYHRTLELANNKLAMKNTKALI